MRALDLSRQWCDAHLLPRLQRALPPPVLNQLAIGLAGHGSECFGFDDDLSTDHDFNFASCIWIARGVLDDKTLQAIRQIHADAVLAAPTTPAPSQQSANGAPLRGLTTIEDFLESTIGFPRVPDDWRIWLHIPEYALAEATNGQLFHDPSGTFTALRTALFRAMPADVLLKRLSWHAILAAQSGQYNAPRCIKHGERGAARLAIAQFVEHVAAMLFLLNGRYAPYYKWLLRGLRGLPRLSELAAPLEDILVLPFDDADIPRIIDDIAAQIIRELRARNLSDSSSDFLEPHAYALQSKIADPAIRQLHVMALD